MHEDNCLNVHALVSWYEEMYETLKKELEEAQRKEGKREYRSHPAFLFARVFR